MIAQFYEYLNENYAYSLWFAYLQTIVFSQHFYYTYIKTNNDMQLIQSKISEIKLKISNKIFAINVTNKISHERQFLMSYLQTDYNYNYRVLLNLMYNNYLGHKLDCHPLTGTLHKKYFHIEADTVLQGIGCMERDHYLNMYEVNTKLK